jgi:hypothetical protein
MLILLSYNHSLKTEIIFQLRAEKLQSLRFYLLFKTFGHSTLEFNFQVSEPVIILLFHSPFSLPMLNFDTYIFLSFRSLWLDTPCAWHYKTRRLTRADIKVQIIWTRDDTFSGRQIPEASLVLN